MTDTSMIEDDQPYREFDDGALRVFGYSYDVQAVQQIKTVSGHGWVSGAALMADNHLGYSMPIGGVAAYREMTSPSGVGYDIGCGVMAVRTDMAFADVAGDLGRLADEIAGRISFGIGRKNPTPVDHALFGSPVWSEVPELTQQVRAKKGPWSLRSRAEAQLGTVGSGNHYVDLLVEPATGELWAACHFGSRGFGHGVATGFLNLAAHRGFFSQMPGGESMHAAPALLPLTEAAARELDARPQDAAARAEIGRRYRLAMELAGEYAYAGREHVIEQVLAILGAHEVSGCTTTTTSPGPKSTTARPSRWCARARHRRFPARRGLSAARWATGRWSSRASSPSSPPAPCARPSTEPAG
jgi:tRNA-splicing ligase RtcB